MAEKKKEKTASPEDHAAKEAARVKELRQPVRVRASLPDDFWRSNVSYENGVTLVKGKPPVEFTVPEGFVRQMEDEGIKVEVV